MFGRWVEPVWAKKFAAPYVHIVFGARQTGKSTLLKRLLPTAAIWLDFSHPAVRSDYLRRPDQLIDRCRALDPGKLPPIVVIDEAQSVPAIFDAVQHLYDSDKKRWRFVLCGSSARKLRVTGANLLPGRSFLHHLFPLVAAERAFPESGKLHWPVTSPLALPAPTVSASSAANPTPKCCNHRRGGRDPLTAGGSPTGSSPRSMA